jgi:hypothetical protein
MIPLGGGGPENLFTNLGLGHLSKLMNAFVGIFPSFFQFLLLLKIHVGRATGADAWLALKYCT